jgi:uncharacterized membrane protein
MVPFLVLFATFTVLFLLGRTGSRPFSSWVTCLRVGLALMFLVTASAHWGLRRPDLVRMVPAGFGDPALLVTLTGIAEIAGAVGLLIPRVAPWAAGGLAVLLFAVFPANVRAAAEGIAIAGTPPLPIVARAGLQAVFLVAVLAAGFWSRHAGGRGARSRTDGPLA